MVLTVHPQILVFAIFFLDFSLPREANLSLLPQTSMTRQKEESETFPQLLSYRKLRGGICTVEDTGGRILLVHTRLLFDAEPH